MTFWKWVTVLGSFYSKN